MAELNKEQEEKFEEIKERIDERKDEFQTKGEEFKDKLKDVKEGWEGAAVEDEDKHRIAEAEETHQTH